MADIEIRQLPISFSGFSRERMSWWLGKPVVLAILAVTIIYPTFWALLGSFQTDDGAWTLANYERSFQPYYFGVLANTIFYAAATVLISIAIALPMAWLVARTNMPGKRLIRALVTVCFVMPPLFHALAFVFLFQPRAGIVNELLDRFLGVRPFNIYSFSGLIIVTAISLFPQGFILIDAALRGVDPSLEEAASTAGASRLQIIRRIVLPLVLPAILSSAVLGMIEALSIFGPPAVIGIPAKIYVMSTQMFVELSGAPPRIEFCAALAVQFLIISGILLYAQERILRRRRYITITGKGFRQRDIELGGFRWPSFALCFGMLIIGLVLPTLVLLVISVSKVWTAGLSSQNLTLKFYQAVLLGQQGTFEGISNTLILGVATLISTIAVGLPVAWIAVREQSYGSRIIRFIAFLPFSIPAVVFTIGVILAFIRPPLILYGTLSIVVVCYFGRFLPFAVQPLSDALRQVDSSLTEAARVAGAGTLRIGLKVTLPLLKYAVLSTAMLVFIACVREIVSIALLYSPGTETVMMMAMLLWDEGQVQTTAAVVVVTIGLVAIFYLLAQMATYRREKRNRYE